MTHVLRPKVVGEPGARRLICAGRRCGEPIVGSFRSYFSWVGGVHESDFLAGRYVEYQWPDDRPPHYADPGL